MPNFSANCVKGVQGVGYLCAFVLSLVICVPMSMHQDQFKGRCLLFSTGVWQETDGQFKVDWASQAYCNFTIFVAVVMFVISLIQFARFVKFFRRGRDSSFFSAFVDVLVCVVMCIFVLIAAFCVTLGFRVWCTEMTRRFETCSGATGNPIDRADGIDSDGFFLQMSTAQFGIWLSFTVWVTLLVFSVVKLCGYHHQENLRVSMAKERKRLLNEDLVSEVPVPQQQQQQQHHAQSNRSSRSRRPRDRPLTEENEGRFEEVVVNGHPDDRERGLDNDVDTQEQEERIQTPPQQQQQTPQQHSTPQQQQQQQDLNVSMDGSSSSMTSSQHSYGSLPKGDQIHVEHNRPDLLN